MPKTAVYKTITNQRPRLKDKCKQIWRKFKPTEKSMLREVKKEQQRLNKKRQDKTYHIDQDDFLGNIELIKTID